MKSVRLLTIAAIVSAAAASLAGALPASANGLAHAVPADTITCHDQQTLESAANADFVSAELGYTGGDYAMLRARATTAGPWEKFEFCFDSTQGWWSIISDANGLFVSAEFGYTGGSFGELRARSSTIGPWEKFVLSCIPGPPVSPHVDWVLIQAQTNLDYVEAELGYTGADYAMLRASASSAGSTAEFYNPTLCP